VSLYEYAGGAPAFLALARAHHARCLADPELNHPFSHPDQHPRHVERLAAYWAEALGGPPRYSVDEAADHSWVLHLHAGNGDLGDLPERFLSSFLAACDDAALPGDPAFREALRAYMQWSLDEVVGHDDPATIRPGRGVPRWSWDGPVQDGGSSSGSGSSRFSGRPRS
jgi:hemoglobin